MTLKSYRINHTLESYRLVFMCSRFAHTCFLKMFVFVNVLVCAAVARALRTHARTCDHMYSTGHFQKYGTKTKRFKVAVFHVPVSLCVYVDCFFL